MNVVEPRYFTDTYRLWLFRVIGTDAEVYDRLVGKWVANQELFDTWNDATHLIEVFKCDSCMPAVYAAMQKGCCSDVG